MSTREEDKKAKKRVDTGRMRESLNREGVLISSSLILITLKVKASLLRPLHNKWNYSSKSALDCKKTYMRFSHTGDRRSLDNQKEEITWATIER